ncbi:HD domain-containing phosphohydrolase [Hahella sp. SMD15-11]|uniref:HD domain-containing phosphohydrolase n=1 Tax=Thermohahella caldifontis TaxID=3142973 RepID=A0AB39UVX8_9GAMM
MNARSWSFDPPAALLQSLLTMTIMVEARDPYTGGHMWRVSRYCQLLAEAAGLSEAQVARVTVGGFLHDLGKVGVPDAILRKPNRLTDAEYATIQTHPDIGARLLATHPLRALVMDAVHSHHEMPNGKGYPRGLAGQDIPLAARITGICDAFDAMTSHRPYRPGMPVDVALDIIERHLGSQFDVALGERFIELGRQGCFEGIVQHSDEGMPLHDCPQCGPTLVVQRDHEEGHKLFCPNCGGGAVVHRQDGRLAVTPVDEKASPRDLVPEVDYGLIDRLVGTVRPALLPDTQAV